MAVLRFGTAGLLLLPVFIRAGVADCAGLGWGRGIVLAVTSGVPIALLMNGGLQLAPAAHGAAITPGTVAVVGVVLAIVWNRVRPPLLSLAGVTIVVVGLACIGIAGSRGESGTTLLGDLCFLLSGLIWGFYPFLLQRWPLPPMTSTAIVAVLSLAYLPVYALFIESHLLSVPLGVVLFHAFNQGVLNMIVGLWLWASAVEVIGAPTTQRFPPLVPVVGTLLAIPLIGEWPKPLQAAGVLLIVGGLALTVIAGRSPRGVARASETAS